MSFTPLFGFVKKNIITETLLVLQTAVAFNENTTNCY